MAKFELNIYGEDDEILKKHETDVVRWKIFLQALEFYEEKDEKTPAEVIEGINTFVKKIFPALTDEELENASVDDVFNTFNQLINAANKIGASKLNAARKVGGTEKNAAGAG